MGNDLTQSGFDLAFAFTRGEAGQYRDDTSAVRNAAIDSPRFDHDPAGGPLGLLVTPGDDLGGQDRTIFDPLMLPASLTESIEPGERAATVFHCFMPASADAPLRHAWYSRDAVRTIDALLRQSGHHQSIGVISGFRENLGGYVRFRSQRWELAGIVADANGKLVTDDGRPLITAGAELITNA